jgi:hypothetical protein
MKKPKPQPSLARRVIDGVEDIAEAAREGVARAADIVEDAVEGVFERRGRARHDNHRNDDVNVIVNVNVDCCSPCPPCPPRGHGEGKPGPGRGGRPTHITGTSDGSVGGGVTTTGDIIDTVTRPPDVWPGSRTQLYLPFLLVRANAGDTGIRPIVGCFWESPDILILPGVAPAAAPPIPPDLGAVAQAGADNTVYAHVWNLGQAPAVDVLVEFYWFNPSMGFDGAHAHLIGATWTDLAGRGSRGCHKLVKCPISWPAMYVNGGHECLVVRVSQPVTDPLAGPEWDASRNRHIGQRNIHVMSAAEAAAKPTIPIAVGPLFGATAQVGVARVNTGAMPWLHLVTNDRTRTLGDALPTGDVGLTGPTPNGTPVPNLNTVPNPRGAGLIGDQHGVTGDNQQVGFHATDGNPGAGNAHIYRVSGTQNGTNIGGYTIVIVG